MALLSVFNGNIWGSNLSTIELKKKIQELVFLAKICSMREQYIDGGMKL